MKKLIYLIIVAALFTLCTATGTFAGGGGGKGGDGDQPRYYSFEDLRSQMRMNLFHFENSNKPTNALVALSYYLDYPMVASKNVRIAAAVKQNPSKYHADGMHLNANWDDSVELKIDWNYFKSTWKGDLLFTRGNGKLHDFVKIFSNWTHVAIVKDSQLLTVFEATLDKGVQNDYAPETFVHITYYTYKRVESVPSGYRQQLVDIAINKYAGLPYLPKVETSTSILTFVFKWCDKDDLSSMYCSKLVYNTFKPYLNMYSGRTVVDNFNLGRPIGGPFFSWIGISPDDIYYSPGLGSDFGYSQNMLRL